MKVHLGKTAFSREVRWLVALFVISVTNFSCYVIAEKKIDHANERRQQSFLIADELRQSSDDLTRMVRIYVLTGESRYKHFYQEILDIRNGVSARPQHYENVYWDLVLEDGVRPRPYTQEKISLLEKMRQAGFTSQEFDKLAMAHENSDALTKLEHAAMTLSETHGRDAQALHYHATLMLSDAAYHQAKADIMRPISEFYGLVDQRTLADVHAAERLALTLRWVMVVLIVVLMLSMWRTYLALRRTLGGSVEEVKAHIECIAAGDFSPQVFSVAPQPNTVAAWLAGMQKQLFDAQLQQQELTAHLAREKERAQVTLSSIGDGVITTDAAGCVTFINAVAIELTGWGLSEALGKPLRDVFNIVNEDTRQRVENPVDLVIRDGKTVMLANHTVLISQHGAEYNIEDSAAPIFLDNGELLGCVLVFHDVTEKHRLMHDVQWQAGHDVLTGLPNRALLSDRFSRALARAQRQQELLAVCLLDLDEFKPINDVHGHGVGDQLLIQIAQRLTAQIRADDTVARLGGDEFVLLLGGVSTQAEAEATLQRVLTAIATPVVLDDKTLQVSASIGVVLFPQDEANSDALLRHADQAMYQAKQAGRNRYHFFDVRHDKEVVTTNQTLSRVRQAVQDGELCLYYQPKVNMRDGTVIGMEALLRWQHPQQGLLAPGLFLPMVEQTDLIIDIGEWVIDAALRQLAVWQAQGTVWPVSVNIAARHFQRADFLQRLQIMLARHAGVSPSLLQIEILESVAQSDLDQVRRLILQCQALEVSFALDDFGTGYSSLSYLKNLPADTLKIDQSFVRDMLIDAEDMALVEAVVGLANVFNRGVIAEGVETSEHGVMLMRLGCDCAQGYGIARPMPAEKIRAWSEQFVPHADWLKWADVPWHLEDFPLLVAAQDHVQWVDQIVKAVGNPALLLDEAQLTNHHQCRFGQWYYDRGRARYGQVAEFVEMRNTHVQVHRIGVEIIRLRDAGEVAAARARLPTLLALREQILAYLQVLQMKVGEVGSVDVPRNPAAGGF